MLVQDLVDEAPAGLRVAHMHLVKGHTGAGLFAPVPDRFCCNTIGSVSGGNVDPGVGQPLGHGAPDPAGAARHQRDTLACDH
jgi:hypothetical protein